MLQLEFGDALRRLREGESLVASHKISNKSHIVRWDSRGLWTLTHKGWRGVEDPMALVMNSSWYKDPSARYSLLPVDRDSEPIKL